MRLDEITDEFYPNKYFIFNTGTPVWLLTGTEPSNHHYGSSQLHRPLYNKVITSPGDELHWLHGGLFYTNGEAATSVQLKEPEEFSPFERRQGSDPKIHQLKSMLQNEIISEIDKTESKKVKYRT